MKKIVYSAFVLISVCMFISATTTGPTGLCDSPIIGDHTGAPGETNCSGCHSSPVNPDLPSLHFEFDGGINQYTPDSTYLVNLKISKNGHDKFGFVCTTLDAGNTAAGSFSLINTTTTRLFTSGGRKYVSHTPCGADAQDSIAWSYKWKAPSTNKGKIYIYMSMLVANHNHALSGDTTYTRVLELNGPPQIVGFENSNWNSINSKITPTVFSDEFTIDFGWDSENKVKSFSLYTLQGKLVFTNSTLKQVINQKVDARLATGMYVLQLESAGKIERHKLLKN